MTHHNIVLSWLNDAYAMERSIVQVLENHAKDAKDHPDLQAKIQEHLEQTKGHADLVKGCIERLGGSTSTVKTGMATVMGKVQGMSTGMAKDELVKNGLHDYGTEYFEMACYKALIAAAEELGDQETVGVCRSILRDEQAMADFLEQQLPMIVAETVRRESMHGAEQMGQSTDLPSSPS